MASCFHLLFFLLATLCMLFFLIWKKKIKLGFSPLNRQDLKVYFQQALALFQAWMRALLLPFLKKIQSSENAQWREKLETKDDPNLTMTLHQLEMEEILPIRTLVLDHSQNYLMTNMLLEEASDSVLQVKKAMKVDMTAAHKKKMNKSFKVMLMLKLLKRFNNKAAIKENRRIEKASTLHIEVEQNHGVEIRQPLVAQSRGRNQKWKWLCFCH